jgi:hypothetical protein
MRERERGASVRGTSVRGPAGQEFFPYPVQSKRQRKIKERERYPGVASVHTFFPSVSHALKETYVFSLKKKKERRKSFLPSFPLPFLLHRLERVAQESS